MEGTVIITGANGSLAIPAVAYLLSEFKPRNVILTVRNDTTNDKNTEQLRATIAQAPSGVNVTVRKLDLASLAEVHAFAKAVAAQITAREIPPLAAVIWNAMSWSLQGGLQLTGDGYERSMAINHIAHFALTLELLSSFDQEHGRIIFLGSDSHEKSAMQKYASVLPADLDKLVYPEPDREEEVADRGFQRYGLSKLVSIMTMYELNRRLVKDGKGLSALAVDPGGLVDSRAFSGPDIPSQWSRKISVVNWLQPLLSFLNPTIRRCTHAAKDVVDLAMGPHGERQTGYFIMSNKAESSKASQDEEMQAELWNRSVEWAGITQKSTSLTL
ncbi:short chain dehydrogenase/reductase SDR [Cucurbitaria berberidis CBS 394.84]|uniref:3beta-hydroxysteroid 3-dehydrogenase n=1 Tax=Cucurbitaria berberidis CBS 394.84 TaxID=1168544 RepID=A0A9P4LA53_9PLEO|nr:short chain dehydrogenase/reductase SDR [Cucurbitaria berberidis CBS 394.84]KAF1846874.1 short chain dehydrogenase/reductase SDR [Cucurbitaria berberidis CBS 394.84]